MFDRFDDIAKFMVIADVGSLHEAAARLEISQPGLTRIVKKLELRFGGALFERLPRGVRLTPLGARMAEHCRIILRERELAEDDLRSLRGGRSGQLRLSSGPVWIFAILPQILPRISAAFPGVTVQLSSRGYHEAVDQLEKGMLDAHVGGFDSLSPLPSHLTRIALFDVDLGVVAHLDHPIFSKAATPRDLTDYPWLDYGTGRSTPNDTWPSVSEISAEIHALCGAQIETVVRCDASGLALMRTPPYLAYLPMTIVEHIPGLNLRRVDIPLRQHTFGTGLILRKSMIHNPLVELLVEEHRKISKTYKTTL